MNVNSQYGEKLIAFCQEYQDIYIYGAGNNAKYYCNILKKMDIQIKGFLTTQETIKHYCGLNVFVAAEKKDSFSGSTGIIGAFEGATETTIRPQVGEHAAILCLEKAGMVYLWYRYLVLPMVKMVSKRYPCTTESLTPIGKWNRILIARLDVLGDLVMTTAFIREIRSNAPNSFIGLVVRKSNKTLFENCPYIDKLYLYEPLNKSLPDQCMELDTTLEYVERYVLASGIKDDNYDIALQPQTLCYARASIENYMLCFASGAKQQVGRVNALWSSHNYFANLMQPYMSLLITEDTAKHEVEYMLDLVRVCGGVIHNDKMEVWFNKSSEQEMANILAQKQNICQWLAFCFMGSTAQKNWSAEKYSELISKLLKDNDQRGVVFIGGKEAVSVAEKISSNITKYDSQIVDMTGKTRLDEVAAIFKQCALYVGADTGIMHIASAVGIPIVEISIALPGHTAADGSVPSRMGPWGVKNIPLMAPYALDECKGICHKTYPHCINLITVDEVYEAVDRILS